MVLATNTKHAKNAKYKNAKEKETKNGLDQNRANTIVQKYKIEKHKEWRKKINWLSCKLFPDNSLPYCPKCAFLKLLCVEIIIFVNFYTF